MSKGYLIIYFENHFCSLFIKLNIQDDSQISERNNFCNFNKNKYNFKIFRK